MRAPAPLLPALRRRTRLIWLVLWTLLLQPLTWAAQPAATWVELPYCATAQQAAAADAVAALPHQATPRHGAPHTLLVLLNPAALCAAPGGLLAPPPASGGHLALTGGGSLQAASGTSALRLQQRAHATPPPRAPPLFS
ncbi:MAG: transcriptional regulator algP [Thiomonas sp.]